MHVTGNRAARRTCLLHQSVPVASVDGIGKVIALTKIISALAKKAALEMSKKKAKKFALEHLGLSKERRCFQQAMTIQNGKW